jgi:hypothetical protein
MVLGLLDLQCYGNLSGNGPHEPHQLMGNGHHDLIGMFPSCYEAAVSFAKPKLSLLADILDGVGWGFQSQLEMGLT